jgi:hypothetical protein
MLKKEKDMKKSDYSSVLNEQGSALVIALIMLVLLTLIGISATTTTQIETQIAGNERTYMHQFYVADSAWKEGVSWVNQMAGAPTPVNFTNTDVVASGTTDLDSSELTSEHLLNVRNFGNESFDPLNNPPSTSPDGKLGRTIRITNYWYRVAYYKPEGGTVSDVMLGRTVAGGGMNEREYDFEIVGNANDKQEVAVTITKPFVTSY